MQVVLVMFTSDGDRRSFSLARDVTVLGRREDSDLRVPLTDISRKHCRFIKEADTLHLEDLGSSNGTFHNGQRVQEAVLAPGDWVSVGPVTFVVQIDGVPADEELQPPVPQEEAAAADSVSDQPAHSSGQAAEDVAPTGEEEFGQPPEAADEAAAAADQLAEIDPEEQPETDLDDFVITDEPEQTGGEIIVDLGDDDLHNQK